MLVVDNASGDVLAYVGGSGDLGSARHVDGIRARRQAGLDAEAVSLRPSRSTGVSSPPASLLEDTPLDLAVAGGLYRPRNYDEQFQRAGERAHRARVVAQRARRAHARPRRRATRPWSCSGASASRPARGGRLLRPVAGARLGRRQPLGAGRRLPHARATAARGRPLRLRRRRGRGRRAPRLFRRRGVPRLDILADRESRSPTFGLENPLATRFWTAVKTGTSKEMRDNWCVGYSRRYTVGVWVGNFAGEPMRQRERRHRRRAGVARGDGVAAPRGAERAARRRRPGLVAAPVDVSRRGRARARSSGSSPGPSRPSARRHRGRRPAHRRARRRARSSRSTPTSRRAGSASSSRRRTRASPCGGCSTATIWAPRASSMSGAPSAAGTGWRWSTATGAWSTA